MATNSTVFFSRLTANSSNTDATSYATASVAPTSGRVVIAIVSSLKATTPDTPTCSGTNGFSGTWTQVGSTVTLQTPAGNFIGVSMFWSVAASSSAGVITFNYGAGTQLAAVWDVIQSPFVNTTTPVVQNGNATDTSASTALPSVTLSAALTSFMNWMVVVFAEQANSTPSVSIAGSYQPFPNQTSTVATDGVGMKTVIVPANALTPASGSFTANVAKIAFAAEIAQDGTGVPTSGGNLTQKTSLVITFV